MIWLILYFIIVIIAYIFQRYLVISGKRFIADDPQGISFLVALFWPTLLLILCIWQIGEYIDKVIKSKING